MRCFNRFASSTWKLGGFEFSNLEVLKNGVEIPDKVTNLEQSALKAKDIQVDDVAGPIIDECGALYIDYARDLKWVKTIVRKADGNTESKSAVTRPESVDEQEATTQNEKDEKVQVVVNTKPTFADYVAKAFADSKPDDSETELSDKKDSRTLPSFCKI